MKTQMRFQRILSYVTLITAALTFVLALIYCTGGIATFRTNYIGALLVSEGEEYGTLEDSFVTVNDKAQSFNSVLFGLSIAFIIIAAFMFITMTHIRRNYYITNYISVCAVAAFGVVVALIIIIWNSVVFASYLSDIDWDVYEKLLTITTRSGNQRYTAYSDSVATFIVAYVIALLVIAVSALNVYNLIWKIKLMKGEKELLAGVGEKTAEEVKEVA